MQADRRRNDYPLTWEPVAAAIAGGAALLMLGVQAGRTAANLIAGEGLTLPERRTWIRSIPKILTGDAGAGLSAPPAHPASPGLLWGSIMVFELLTLAALIWAIVLLRNRFGRGQIRGTASTSQISAILGPARLRKNRHVIRPDLYPGPRSGRVTATDLPSLGWRLGNGAHPRCGALWVPWDRTAGVVGPQGSGKTLDVLIPALLAAPGAALTTLTKVDDLLLSLNCRQRDGRPVAVLDPFGAAPGLPELVWDPVAGCVDPMLAERRAKAFTAGTIHGSATDSGDSAARFYAGEAAKVLQAYFHAAALAGYSLEHILRWVANPTAATEPGEILRTHPAAAPFWGGLLHGSLHGDPRTAGNTTATVQQAMSLFFQPGIRGRCVPSPGRPPTDVADLIARGGTIYLLGREDPYASASPLMTALAEHVLDTALAAATSSPWGKLCPPLLACLDELPSTAPLPTLRTRMANERALGISIMWAAQTRQQLSAIYGHDEARALIALTNVLAIFGGSKDPRFNQDLSDLIGSVTVPQISYNGGKHPSRTISHREIPILTGAEIRELAERTALVIPENSKPLLAQLHRCIDGKEGKALLAQQRHARDALTRTRAAAAAPAFRAGR